MFKFAKINRRKNIQIYSGFYFRLRVSGKNAKITPMWKASVTKRRGIGPIRTEISPFKIRKRLFIFLIFRVYGIGIWQNYFCILSNFGDFGAKTSLFRYLINQKRNNFIKHCSPPCIYKPPISEIYIHIRHNLYKWGLDTRGGTMFYRQKMGGGSAYNTWNTL